ncbi:MAG: hypothetical protein Q9172_006875 [Xanthocarpia lactea]
MMPSPINFVILCFLAAAASGSAFTEGTTKSGMEERDLTVIINTQKEIPTAHCDGKTCFTECADKGAIGGAL